MRKKITIVLITVLILFVSVGIANASTGNLKVDWLIEEGFVKGDIKGYRLNDNITRAETTKMVVEAGGLGEQVPTYKHLASMFNDVAKSHWANGYINVAVINQLVNGYSNGSYLPNNNITYAEILKMLVMANGDIPNTDMYSGPLWAIPYIAKAEVLGITEGVNITNHNAIATREKVFELVYNTMFEEEEIIQEEFEEEYNAMVIENKRVAGLDDTEITLVILEALDSTSDSSPRYDMNDEIEIILPKRIEDVEYLLGKVVDITIDNNNIATRVRIDDSYSYFDGPILASEYEIYLGANGEYYKDRILAVYHNDRGYDYDDYIEKLGDYDSSDYISFLAEYASVTVKNGKAYFIDSYTFSDIAPVNSVNRNGSEVYIYDDGNKASISKTSIDNVVGYTYDWGLESLDPRDIEEGDIVHFYNRNSALVNRDSKNYGVLNDVFEDSGYYFADIDGYEYQIRVTKDRRPIFSNNGVDYHTLDAENLTDSFWDLMNRDIIFLLDINGHIQFIQDDK